MVSTKFLNYLSTQAFPVSPNGMMFVKPEVRKGLLSRMLVELLDTRVMVKQAMKGAKNDKVCDFMSDC